MADRKVTIEISSKDLSSGVMEDIAKAARGLGGAFSEASGHVNLFGSGLVGQAAHIGFTIGQLRELGTAIHDVAESFLGPAVQAEKAGAQLDAVLKSTGHAAGLERAEIEKLSTELSKMVPFDDEVITKTQSMLLTFTNIGRDIMPQATEAVLDMATALGEDTQSAAIRLGKALQDPIQGVTALRRVGVQLTDDQEKLVLQLVKTGRGAEAQKVILQELQTEFGNSARAAGDTFAGKLTILTTQLDNVREVIGGPLLGALSDLLTDITPLVIGFAESEDGAQSFADVLRDELIPKAHAFWEDNLVPMIDNLRDEFPGAAEQAISDLGSIALAAGDAAAGIKEIVGWLNKVSGGIEGLKRLNDEMNRSPLTAAGSGGTDLGTGFNNFLNSLLGGKAGRAISNPSSGRPEDAFIGPLLSEATIVTAADERAAQRAAQQLLRAEERANTYYWANSDDPEAVAWRAAQKRPQRTPNFNLPEEKKGPKGPKTDFLTAAEGFMSGLVAETANMEAAFGKEGGKLASALIAGISADVAQAGSAGKAVATALESLLVQAEKAGVPEWRETGDKLAGALLAALQDGAPNLRAEALEQIRSVTIAINEASFWKEQGVAGQKMADAINVAIDNTVARVAEIKKDAQAAKDALFEARDIAEHDQALRQSLSLDLSGGLANLQEQQRVRDLKRQRDREDVVAAEAQAKTLFKIEGDFERDMAAAKALSHAPTALNTVASEAPRLAAERAAKARHIDALAKFHEDVDTQTELTRVTRANQDADLVHAKENRDQLDSYRLLHEALNAEVIKTQIEEPAFQRQLTAIDMRAFGPGGEVEKALAAQTQIELNAQNEYTKTTTALAEKWQVRYESEFNAAKQFLIDPLAEELAGVGGSIFGRPVSGGAENFAPVNFSLPPSTGAGPVAHPSLAQQKLELTVNTPITIDGREIARVAKKYALLVGDGQVSLGGIPQQPT